MKKCKILATLLALVLVLSSLPVLALTASADDGINTYDKLVAAITKGDTVITLTDDVDVNGNTTLGTLAANTVINGNGHKLYNVGVATGLFTPTTNVTIKNLTVETVTGNAEVTTTAVAILLKNGTYSFTIDNVHIKSNVTFTVASTAKNAQIGGFTSAVVLPEGTHSKITNSTFTGTVNYARTNYLGGFMSAVSSTSDATAELTIANCVNNANLTSTTTVSSNRKNCYAGGFIGNVAGTIKQINLLGCVNNGAINATAHGGGLIAYTKTSCVIEKCVNFGNVSTDNATSTVYSTGGLIGKTDKSVTLKNSANVANVNGAGTKENYVGGLIACVTTSGTNVDVTNCVSIGDITGKATNWGDYGIGYATSNTVTITKFENFKYMGTLTGKSGGNATAKVTAGSHNSGILGWGDGAELENKTAAVAALNALAIANFYLDGDTIKMNANVPQLVGVQQNEAKDAVRFVAVLKDVDLTKYENIGFKVSATLNGEAAIKDEPLNSKSVMTTLKATVGDATTLSTKTYTATELGGAYIVALSITGVPTTGTVVFTVTPYVNGTQTGTAWTLTFESGALTNAAPVADAALA